MKKTIEIPERWALSTDMEDMNEVFGIEKDRFDHLNTSSAKSVAALMFDPEVSNNAGICERALNTASPQTAIELFALGWMLGRAQQKTENLLEKLMSVMPKED